MVSYRDKNNYFKFRAIAVFLHNNQVLIQQISSSKRWSLPGGKVEFFESTQDAIVREIQEELEVDITIDRLLWVNENLFKANEVNVHELGYYFLVSLPNDHPLYLKKEPFVGPEILPDGATTTFRWYPIDHLNEINFFPIFLHEKLASLPKTTEQIISCR